MALVPKARPARTEDDSKTELDLFPRLSTQIPIDDTGKRFRVMRQLILPLTFWVVERDVAPSLTTSPDVIVVLPARNEREVIRETARSLLAQEFPGRLRIVLVDDQSDDGTAEDAMQAAAECGAGDRLTVIRGEPLPDGWVGKVWAMHQGVTRGIDPEHPPQYILFSDADISHGPNALTELVSRAEAGPCDLVTFMVRLQCNSFAEKLMIPAFVFFFRMLYPFRLVNDPKSRVAGAAGGTMLVRWEALQRIGGLESIQGAVIDDCSLAREIKRGGHRIWLGLSRESVSTRSYGTLGEIIRMISRTAYTQLHYSPVLLVLCILGLAITYLAPPALAIFAHGLPRYLGLAAWLIMTLLYLPMVRFYNQSPLWAPFLPVTAALYAWATIRSAWRYHTGRGSEWKSRVATAAKQPQVVDND